MAEISNGPKATPQVNLRSASISPTEGITDALRQKNAAGPGTDAEFSVIKALAQQFRSNQKLPPNA